MVTMLLGGLWHGANWTFVAWGGLHGLALVGVHWFRRLGWSCPAWIGWLVTFHFVTLAWVFFRAPDFTTAMRVLHSAITLPIGDGPPLFAVVLFALFSISHPFDRLDAIRSM